ncbi:MAG: hypothetical protein KDC85_22190, partial [Saprospiraceae bacterium]|nr:hypothetical protein [Saprospiraceae bacterium]
SIENKSIALQHDLPISGYKRLQTTVNGYHTTNYAQPPIFVKSPWKAFFLFIKIVPPAIVNR